MSAPPKLSKEDKKAFKDALAASKIMRGAIAEMNKNQKDPLVKAQLQQIDSHKAAGHRLDLAFVSALVGPVGRVINATLVPASQMVSSIRAAPSSAMPPPMPRSVAGSSSDTSAQISTNTQIQDDEVYAQSLDAGVDPLDENFSYGMYDDMVGYAPSPYLRPIAPLPSAASYYHGPPDLSAPHITNYANGIAIATSAAGEANAIIDLSASPPPSPFTPMGNYNMAVINAKTMEIIKQQEVERRHSDLADKQQRTEDMVDLYATLDEDQRRDVKNMIAFQAQALNHRSSHSEILQFLKIVQIPSLRAEMNDIVGEYNQRTMQGLANSDMPDDMGGNPTEEEPAAMSGGHPFRDVLAEGMVQAWNRDHGFINSAEYENLSPIKRFSKTSGNLRGLISTFVEGEPFELDDVDYKKLKKLGVFKMNVGSGVGAGGGYEPRLDPKLWIQNANGSWSYAHEFYKAKDAEAWAQNDVRTARYAEFERQKQANNKHLKKMVPREGQELFRTQRAPAGSGEDIKMVSMGHFSKKTGKMIAVNPSGPSDGLGRISNKMDARPGGNFKHYPNYKDLSDRSAHPDNTVTGFSSAIPAPASASSGLYNPTATGFLSDQLSKNAGLTLDSNILMSAAQRAAIAREIADRAKEDNFKTLGAAEWSILNKLQREKEENATEAARQIGRDAVPGPSAARAAPVASRSKWEEDLGPPSEWDDPIDMSTSTKYISHRVEQTNAEKAQHARDQAEYDRWQEDLYYNPLKKKK